VLATHASGHFIYRGENSATYKLRPKVGRFDLGTETEGEELEEHVLREFSRRSVPFLIRPPENNLEWMALAQHHGLATRLLDWSTNLFVAAHFAVHPYLGKDDRVIYALNVEDFEMLDEEDDPFASKRVALYEPAHVSPRVSAQMGIFTVHPYPMRPFVTSKLERWVIKGDCVISMGITLDRVGFNSSSLFPGLDGLASHLNRSYIDFLPDAA
jgi:FRG domain